MSFDTENDFDTDPADIYEDDEGDDISDSIEETMVDGSYDERNIYDEILGDSSMSEDSSSDYDSASSDDDELSQSRSPSPVRSRPIVRNLVQPNLALDVTRNFSTAQLFGKEVREDLSGRSKSNNPHNMPSPPPIAHNKPLPVPPKVAVVENKPVRSIVRITPKASPVAVSIAQKPETSKIFTVKPKVSPVTVPVMEKPKTPIVKPGVIVKPKASPGVVMEKPKTPIVKVSPVAVKPLTVSDVPALPVIRKEPELIKFGAPPKKESPVRHKVTVKMAPKPVPSSVKPIVTESHRGPVRPKSSRASPLSAWKQVYQEQVAESVDYGSVRYELTSELATVANDLSAEELILLGACATNYVTSKTRYDPDFQAYMESLLARTNYKQV